MTLIYASNMKHFQKVPKYCINVFLPGEHVCSLLEVDLVAGVGEGALLEGQLKFLAKCNYGGNFGKVLAFLIFLQILLWQTLVSFKIADIFGDFLAITSAKELSTKASITVKIPMASIISFEGNIKFLQFWIFFVKFELILHNLKLL